MPEADFAFCPACGASISGTKTEERRFVTVLFADLVDFTAGSDQADPEDVRARLTPYHRRVREEIEAFGGTVEKLIGDGVMAVFGVPTAHEDDPERAVRAALRIQEAVEELGQKSGGSAFSVRIGINSGEAMVTTGGEGERIVGDVVNTASRLESIAPPGGVVVGEATHRATELLIVYEEMKPVDVKGKALPLTVWRAVEPRGRYGIDAAVRTYTPFLGRESEMASLREKFRRVIDDGSLQLVTIAAAPGLGKSRLVNEFWNWADEQPEIVWWRQGRCLPYGEGITFWALGEIVKGQAGILESDDADTAGEKLAIALEAICDDSTDRDWLTNQLGPLVGVGTHGGDRSESFAAWRRFLEDLAARQPLVMVVEDLHWADVALVDFLEDLLVWSMDSPILVICTARPELYETHPGWGGGHHNSSTLSLSPLGDEQIARLISVLLERAVLPADTQRVLLERADGNPLYAEEFVRMLTDRGLLHPHGQMDESAAEIPVPETVQALIGSRLDLLPESDARVIEDASVVGKVFWDGAISAMTNHDDLRGALRRLAAGDWVRPVRRSSVEGVAEYAFWHALTRDVAYGRITRRARAEKHRLMAEWIETATGERAADHAELLAYHYVRALELAEASGVAELGELRSNVQRALVLAGDRATRLDPVRAHGYYLQALDLMGEDDPRRPPILIKAAERVMDAAELSGALDLLEEAARLGKARDDKQTAAKALQLIHLDRWFHSGTGAGRAALDEALEILEGEPPGPVLAGIYGILAGHYMLTGELDEALAWAEKSIAVVEDPDVDVLIRGFNGRGIARFHLGDVASGMEDLRKAVELAETSSVRSLAVAYTNLADHTWWDEGPVAANQVYAAGIRIVEARGGAPVWMHAETMWTNFDLGEWDEVLRIAGDLIARYKPAQEAPMLLAWAQSYRARVLAWRGQLQEARALHEMYLGPLRDIEDLQLLTPALAISATIESEKGDHEEALALLDECFAITEGRSPILRSFILTDGMRMLVKMGDLERAQAWADGTRAPGWRGEIASATALALLTETSGEHEEALSQFRKAASDWGEFGHVLEEAMARYGAGRCLTELGRGEEAQTELTRARELLVSLGATPTIHEIDGVAEQATAL